MTPGVASRAVGATALLSAFAAGVFSAAREPRYFPPPFGGDAHAVAGSMLLAGLLLGAVFAPWPWMRAALGAQALAFVAFETAYLLPFLDSVGSVPTAARRLDRALVAGALVDLFVLGFGCARHLDARLTPKAGN